jgi:putative transposase
MHQNLFQRQEVAELMVSTLLKYRDAGEFELHEYVVMPDHLHVLLSIQDQQPLSRAVQLIKGGFSYAVRENGIMMRAVWQQRYHDRRVRDANEFAEMAQYIRQNPVRRGLVGRAEEYPYSSAKVLGLKPLIEEKDGLDASLKARSTGPSNSVDASLKACSTGFSNVVDASLTVRSTGPSSEVDTGLKGENEIVIDDAELKVRCIGKAILS